MSEKTASSLDSGDVAVELSAVTISPSEGSIYPSFSPTPHYPPPTKAISNLVRRKPLSTLAFEDVGYTLPKGRCHCIRRNKGQKTILQGAS